MRLTQEEEEEKGRALWSKRDDLDDNSYDSGGLGIVLFFFLFSPFVLFRLGCRFYGGWRSMTHE